jgi:hypothetical protein
MSEKKPDPTPEPDQNLTTKPGQVVATKTDTQPVPVTRTNSDNTAEGQAETHKPEPTVGMESKAGETVSKPAVENPVPVTKTLSGNETVTQVEAPALVTAPGATAATPASSGTEPATTPPAADPKPEPNEVSDAVLSAYQANKTDDPKLISALRERGLILAVVSAPDLTALAAETASNPRREFPPLNVGDLVAVDRFGDVHALALEPGDLAGLKLEVEAVGAPAVFAAQATFAAEYAPTAAKRAADANRLKVSQIQEKIVTASQGDPRGVTAALTALTEMVAATIPADTAADHLRAAMAATSAGQTVPAANALAAAHAAILSAPATPAKADAVKTVGAARRALTDGKREEAMDLTRQTIEAVEKTD